MSEPELAYMTGSNDDFDLPRYAQDSLATYNDPPLSSSSAQAAHAAQQAAYARLRVQLRQGRVVLQAGD